MGKINIKVVKWGIGKMDLEKQIKDMIEFIKGKEVAIADDCGYFIIPKALCYADGRGISISNENDINGVVGEGMICFRKRDITCVNKNEVQGNVEYYLETAKNEFITITV